MTLLQPRRVAAHPVFLEQKRPRTPLGHIPSDARWYEINLDPEEWAGCEHRVIQAWNVDFMESPGGERVLLLDSWRSKDYQRGYIRVDWPATFDEAEYFDGPNIQVFDLGPTPPLTISDEDHFGGKE